MRTPVAGVVRFTCPTKESAYVLLQSNIVICAAVGVTRSDQSRFTTVYYVCHGVKVPGWIVLLLSRHASIPNPLPPVFTRAPFYAVPLSGSTTTVCATGFTYAT